MEKFAIRTSGWFLAAGAAAALLTPRGGWLLAAGFTLLVIAFDEMALTWAAALSPAAVELAHAENLPDSVRLVGTAAALVLQLVGLRALARRTKTPAGAVGSMYAALGLAAVTAGVHASGGQWAGVAIAVGMYVVAVSWIDTTRNAAIS